MLSNQNLKKYTIESNNDMVIKGAIFSSIAFLSVNKKEKNLVYFQLGRTISIGLF